MFIGKRLILIIRNGFLKAVFAIGGRVKPGIGVKNCEFAGMAGSRRIGS